METAVLELTHSHLVTNALASAHQGAGSYVGMHLPVACNTAVVPSKTASQ